MRDYIKKELDERMKKVEAELAGKPFPVVVDVCRRELAVDKSLPLTGYTGLCSLVFNLIQRIHRELELEPQILSETLDELTQFVMKELAEYAKR